MSLLVFIGHAQIWGLVIRAEKCQIQRPKGTEKLGLFEEQKKTVGQEHCGQIGSGGMSRNLQIPVKGDFKASDFEQLVQLLS